MAGFDVPSGFKLGLVTASFPYGRDEAFLSAEVSALADLGVDLVIMPVRPRGPRRADVEVADAAPGLVSSQVLGAALGEVGRNPRVLHALGPMLRGRGAAVARTAAAAPKALWMAGEIRRRGLEHVHASWCDWTASIAMIAADLAGVGFSFTAHRGDIEAAELLGLKCRRAEYRRSISHAGLSLLRERGAPAQDFDVVHLGVRVPEDPPPWPSRRTRPVVVTPARLVPLKRHCDLLEAVALTRAAGIDLEWWVVGDGPCRDSLAAAIGDRSMGGSVRLMGDLDHEVLLDLYRRAEVDLVSLGSQIEGIPVSLMEAMAHRIAVVATDVGGVAELVRPGAGVLVPAGDPEAMAAAWIQLLRDEGRRRRLAEAGRAIVESDFDSRSTAARWLWRVAPVRGAVPA